MANYLALTSDSKVGVSKKSGFGKEMKTKGRHFYAPNYFDV